MNHLVVKTKVNQYDSKAKVGIFGMSAIFSVSSGSLQETVNDHCSAQQSSCTEGLKEKHCICRNA